VKHAPKRFQKSIIPDESCKDPKILNNAVRIEELKKAKADKTEEAREIEKARSPLQKEERCNNKILKNLKMLLIKMKIN